VARTPGNRVFWRAEKLFAPWSEQVSPLGLAYRDIKTSRCDDGWWWMCCNSWRMYGTGCSNS